MLKSHGSHANVVRAGSCPRACSAQRVMRRAAMLWFGVVVCALVYR